MRGCDERVSEAVRGGQWVRVGVQGVKGCVDKI